MRGAHGLLGLYVPGDSWWHRVPVPLKYLVIVMLTLPALILQLTWLTVACLALGTVALLTTRLAWTLTLQVSRGLGILLAVLAGSQLLLGQPEQAVIVPGNLLTAVFAARLLTFTTTPAEIVDALVAGVDWIPGVDGQRFALAVGVMLRSIPFLIGTFGDVRDAARARGLERNFLARLTPVVVRAVGFAQATGAALDARGLVGTGVGSTREQ